MSKQLWGWWFDNPSRSLWRHFNASSWNWCYGAQSRAQRAMNWLLSRTIHLPKSSVIPSIKLPTLRSNPVTFWVFTGRHPTPCLMIYPPVPPWIPSVRVAYCAPKRPRAHWQSGTRWQWVRCRQSVAASTLSRSPFFQVRPILNILQTMMTSSKGSFSALLALCEGNSPVTGESPTQRPVTRSFDVIFFYLRRNKRLRKSSTGWWFDTPSGPLWSHCNEYWWGSARLQ